MSYQVTARKWRPMVFDDVVGQNHVTSTLRNAIVSKRVAHAYIFSGTRGCGKTTTARILARALNCLSPVNQNPDNTCDVCKEIIESRSLDVIEIDGASNRGVEEIRNLRDSVRYIPAHGIYKIYIIDEVHMLTKEAFNALLKTLEEPPPHVVFIFATTEVHKVPMTILSRCQRFDFRRITIEEIIKSLSAIARAEQIAIEEDALLIIAKRADGSMRDAQSIFDQVRSFCGTDIHADELLKAFNVVDQELYFRFTDILLRRDVRGAIQLVDEVLKNGYDVREFIGGLSEHLRNILIVRSTESTQLVEGSEHYKKRYEVISQSFPEPDILRYLKLTNELDQALRWASQPRYRLESGLIQMVQMESSVQIGELLRQMEELKKKINNPRAISGSTPDIHMSRQTPVSPTELKVVGKVGAGYMASKSVVNYSSLIGTDLAKMAGVSRLETLDYDLQDRNHSHGEIHSVSSEEVAARWPDFISDVSKSHIAVGTLLLETQIIDIQGTVVRVACPDAYHFATLKRHRDFLSTALHQAVGKQVVIEPVLSSSSSIPVKSVFTTVNQSSNTQKLQENKISPEQSPQNDHPILALLKRELGVERAE